jgi:hypothetical protein
MRYCLLVGMSLHYYKSDRDAASFDPRGVVQLQVGGERLQRGGGKGGMRRRCTHDC